MARDQPAGGGGGGIVDVPAGPPNVFCLINTFCFKFGSFEEGLPLHPARLAARTQHASTAYIIFRIVVTRLLGGPQVLVNLQAWNSYRWFRSEVRVYSHGLRMTIAE